MVLRDGILVSLVYMLDRIPLPPPPAKRPRGRPPVYSHRLLLKALIGMSIRRRYTAWAPLAFLSQDDPLAHQLRALLTEQGRSPSGPGNDGWQACRLPCPRESVAWGGLW